MNTRPTVRRIANERSQRVFLAMEWSSCPHMKPLSSFALLALTALLGCSSKTQYSAPVPGLADTYWLPEAPKEAVSVSEARAQSASSATVTVHGRVGDFVASRAQFQLVDEHYQPCNSKPGDTCPTPWDFCCVPPDELARAVIVVEFRAGAVPSTANLVGFHGFDHLASAIVTGHLEKDAAGNVVLVASGLHVL